MQPLQTVLISLRSHSICALLFVAAAVLLCPLLLLPGTTQKRPAKASIHFVNKADAGHVRFVLDNSSSGDKPIIDSVPGGLSLFDFDNDGYPDIYFTNGAQLPIFAKDDPRFYNHLYRNNRNGTFTDVTEHAGVRGQGYSMGVAAADYDNDGWTDFYVTGYDRNILYHNNHDGTFSDVTLKAAVTAVSSTGAKPWSVAAAWLDYDNDGRLDLFVVNYLDWSFAVNRVCGDPDKRLSCSPEMYGPTTDTLFHNNGDGTFSDVSAATGIAARPGKGMSVSIADYDDDGFTDLFVTNDKEPNMLLHNEGGKSFRELAVETGAGYNQDGIAVSSMGVDFRDIDNDGKPDAVVTALAGETFLLFSNLGGGLFSEHSYQTGLGNASLQMSGWGIGIYDFDNDGFPDIFTANSHASENVSQYGSREYRQPNTVFRNGGDGKFQNVTSSAGSLSEIRAAHRGAAFGDLNNDGKVDAVVSAIGSPAEVWINDSEPQQHWLTIRTVGRTSNRDGIGTRIKLTSSSGRVQYNSVNTAVGYASSSDPRVHFGLGNDLRVNDIELRWPSGVNQRLRNVQADRILLVTEPQPQ